MKEKDIKTIQNRFEVFYKEYSEYDQFVKSDQETKKEGMKKRVEEIWENNASEEDLVEFNRQITVYPQMYIKDLNALKEKLLVAYDMVEGIVEIPAEIKTEIEQLKPLTDKPMFIVKQNKPIPVDEERINLLLNVAKAPQYIKQALEIVTNMKNLAEFKGE